MNCRLCPRKCGADRVVSMGVCGAGRIPRIAKAIVHMWEEPVISGERGSGAVFFSGCHLRCVFCQNHEIMNASEGEICGAEELSGLFLELERKGVHNINLVSASHYADVVAESLRIAKGKGLSIPVVYNTGGYEKEETVDMLAPFVDVWLPDFKYSDSVLSTRLSKAPDYPEIALAAIKAMRKHRPQNIYKETGGGERIIEKGVIIRHLVLPSCGENSRNVLAVCAREFLEVPISLMNQYYPIKHFDGELKFLNRALTEKEYGRAVDYMDSLGLTGYTQEISSASPIYTPEFKAK